MSRERVYPTTERIAMEKYKYFLKNIGLMTLSNFASKILSFLLVPLYTSVLSTDDYGLYDNYTTTAFLLVPLLSGAVSQAALRFSMDATSDRSQVFSEAIRTFIQASLVIVAVVAINCWLNLIPLFNEYPIYFVLYYVFCLLSDILLSFARGIDCIFDVAIAGIISSAVIIILNVTLLLIFPMGVSGYFIANISAFVVVSIYLVVRLRLWTYITARRNKALSEEMAEYSRPLIFDQIAWWINNVSDRYIVTWICGAAANGIYSVAFKIPSILNVFQSIFNQAWTLSAVKEINESSGKFYSRIYSIYNCGLVLLCSLLLVGDKFIARILYANDFYQAWQYAPLLTISVVFSCLCGVFEGIFAAAKETKILASTTIVGAVINIAMNLILVRYYGPLGAAFSTMVSYGFVWFARLNKASSIVPLNIHLSRDLASYAILLLQSFFLILVTDSVFMYAIEVMLLLLIVLLYVKDLKVLVSGLLSKIKS